MIRTALPGVSATLSVVRPRFLAATVGWVASWAYAMVLLPHYLGTCTMGSADGWTISLIFYLPLAWLAVVLAMLGRPWARVLRWLSLPHLATIALGLSVIWPYFWGTTVQGLHVCHVRDGGFEGYPVDGLQRAWAPVQLAGLLTLAAVMAWFWKGSRGESEDTSSPASREDSVSVAPRR